MNLTSKTPSNVRIYFKENFSIKMWKVLLVFHNTLVLLGYWIALNPKNK